MKYAPVSEREEAPQPAREFEPEEIDLARLLPRLRERPRRMA